MYFHKETLNKPPELINIRVTDISRMGDRMFAPPDWTFVLIDYHGRIRIDDANYDLRPGLAILMPPHAERTYTDVQWPSPHRNAQFNLRTLDRIEPTLWQLDRDFVRICELFDATVASYATQPRRADARFWNLLWELTDLAPLADDCRGDVASLVRAATARIEAELAEPLYVSQLAKALSVSHNTLTAAFRSELHTTIVKYIRQRRMHHADYLLRCTDLPIKVIAAEIGIPDLQHFNHCVNRQFGCSPSAYRRAHS